MFLCTSKICSYWNILNPTLFSIRHHWSSGFPLLLGLDTDLALRPSRSLWPASSPEAEWGAPLPLASMFQTCCFAVHPARRCFFLMQAFPYHVPTCHVLSWDLDLLNPPTLQSSVRGHLPPQGYLMPYFNFLRRLNKYRNYLYLISFVEIFCCLFPPDYSLSP